MICLISSYLSPSGPQLYCHLRTRSQVIPVYLSMPWSRVDTQYSIHQVQHTPCTAYTEYCIHRILHHSKMDSLPLPASFSALSGPCCTEFSTFPQLQVNQWIESQLPSQIPSDLPPPDSLPPDSLPPDWLPPDWPPSDQQPPDLLPPSASLSSLDLSVSMCISKLAWARPPSAFLSSLDLSLQVFLQTCSITASKPISESTRAQSPSASTNMLDHGHQVHLEGATAVVQRYRGNGGGLSDGKYIFGRPRSR